MSRHRTFRSSFSIKIVDILLIMTTLPRVPGVSYLVCATQRSGSTLLCELLNATEVAGVPDEYFEGLRATGIPRQPRQYFEDPSVAHIAERLAPTEPGEPERPGQF